MAQNYPDPAVVTAFGQEKYSDSAANNDTTDYTNTWAVTKLDTEGKGGKTQTPYRTDWIRWHGYYREIPEISTPIDKKAIWTVGEGFDFDPKTPERTKKIFSKLKGFGKDTTLGILANAVRTYTMGGDFYAEIIKDNQGRLINLKPLNPGTIEIVLTPQGMIDYYNQVLDINGKTEKMRIEKEDMFHLPWNRIADEGHGIPTFQDLEKTIEMYQESKQDMRVVFHRYVKPLLITEVNFDDPTEVASFKAKLDNALNKGENMVIPKDVANVERVSIPQFSTLDPLPWQRSLFRIFLMKEGVPSSVVALAMKEDTESSSKIIFFAWEIVAKWNQKFLEDQIEAQLGIKLKFKFTRSIQPELVKDEKKDKNSGEVDQNTAEKKN